jgi:hypothetical protein
MLQTRELLMHPWLHHLLVQRHDVAGMQLGSHCRLSPQSAPACHELACTHVHTPWPAAGVLDLQHWQQAHPMHQALQQDQPGRGAT